MDIARKKLPLVNLFQQDLNLPISQKSDIIFCTEVFEHLLEPELVIKNILSTLNPNGYLIITVPDGRKDTYEGHINFWSPENWNIFIKKNAPTFYFETGKFNEKILFALIYNK